jgi:putative flippase GtrA
VSEEAVDEPSGGVPVELPLERRRRIPDTFHKVKNAIEDLARSRGARMFGRNTVASTIAFALDLLILWGMVELLEVPRVIAAVIAFFIPMTLFYYLEREWVFPETQRGVAAGYAYFMVNIGIGFVVMLAVYWGLLLWTDMHYLLARIAGSIVSGIVAFLLNGFFNFKQL